MGAIWAAARVHEGPFGHADGDFRLLTADGGAPSVVCIEGY